VGFLLGFSMAFTQKAGWVFWILPMCVKPAFVSNKMLGIEKIQKRKFVNSI